MNLTRNPSQRLISASLLRLRTRSPFFATLALFTRFIPSQRIPIAATNGIDIFFNPDYLQSLPTRQQDGLLLHEVLHAALLHVFRRGVREKLTWNIAADIVVNGTIAQQKTFELPPNAIRDPSLEHLSVEEIYELLLQQQHSHQLTNPDLLDNFGNADSEEETSIPNPQSIPQESLTEDDGNQASTANSQPSDKDSLAEAKKAELEVYWQNARQQAVLIAETTQQGTLPAGMERELGALKQAQLDWRSYLWRYLVKTPTDFTGFDRRFIGRGMYLETLEGESVKVYVAVDTSGSISPENLQMFLSEVQGILSAYPHLEGELYYADAAIYGPYEIDPNTPLPQPEGGGGTSFIPFFQKIEDRWDGISQGVCIYLTDGYGSFPEVSPSLPVLWVVTAGGLGLGQFPFGEAVRLLSKASVSVSRTVFPL